MFRHTHPYEPFIPPNTTKLIVGTIPPPRFSTGKLYMEDVNFCYGSKYGLLWPILNTIFDLNLEYSNTELAIRQRKDFLSQYNIGICDMIKHCEREKMDASDLGMKNIQLRRLIDHLNKNPSIETILLMGGNSKNGPEYLFRKHLQAHGLKLKTLVSTHPKIHKLHLNYRIIKTVSLISPSSAANRSIGANPVYKKLKSENKIFTTFDFRLNQYREYFS